MSVAVSSINGRTFSGITLKCASASDMHTYNGLAHCGVDVGNDFVIGLATHRKYWSLEHSTGITQYHWTLQDLRDWIKYCREQRQ